MSVSLGHPYEITFPFLPKSLPYIYIIHSSLLLHVYVLQFMPNFPHSPKPPKTILPFLHDTEREYSCVCVSVCLQLLPFTLQSSHHTPFVSFSPFTFISRVPPLLFASVPLFWLKATGDFCTPSLTLLQDLHFPWAQQSWNG